SPFPHLTRARKEQGSKSRGGEGPTGTGPRQGSTAMARYVVPIVLACIYVAGATWVVQREGQSYRDSLRPARPEAGTAPAPPDAPPLHVDPDRKESATPEPANSRPERPSVEPTSTPEPHHTPKRPEEKTTSPPPPTSPPPSTAISTKSPPETTAPTTSKNSAANIS